MHKSQVFFYLLSAFLAGVFLASIFNLSLSFIYILATVGIAIVAVTGLKNKPALLIVFMLFASVVGIARFNSFNLNSGNLIEYAEQEVALKGYIGNEPEIKENIQRFFLNYLGEKILVTTNAYPRYKFGDFLEVSGKLEQPKNLTSLTGSGQAEFDYVTHLKKDGVRTTLFFPDIIKSDNSLSLGFQEDLRIVLYKRIFLLKDAFQNAVNKSISEPNSAFINGILLGSRQNIPNDLKEAFNKTGTTHILAISGYNIMIISWAVLSALVYVFKRRTAFWISVAIIILFVILTGASASVVRAAVMGLLLSFANGYGKLYEQKNSIILAGAAMVWINPFVLVFDIGFQLSFAAVLGLIYIYPWIESVSYKIPNPLNLKELTTMTVSAQIAVAPLLIYYFKNFSLISLPVNVLILPFIPAAMLIGFITGIVGMVYLPVGQVIGYSAWAITSYQIWVVRLFS